MSKVFKIIGTISGVVSMVGNIIAPGNPISAALAVNAGLMNTLAKVTAKKPPAQGSMTTILIQANAASPYLMGETYYGGVMRHDVGYGGKVSKVQNPYRAMPIVYSGCGPVDGLVDMYADFIAVPFSGAAATGYYAGFMYRDYQLGATPESDALAAQWGGMPGWSSAHKLSGKAAIMWSLKFDKDGEKYAGAVPQLGAVWRGVKVYDPRLDSTHPGGSGSHRITNEATWAYSQNPALHALTYAYGRYKSGKKIFGIGLPATSILIANYVAWANVCDANGWKVGGIIFEPGDRWANLKRIMAAGSAEPIFAGGSLSVKYDAPRVSLVTITADDMADSDGRVRAMQTWRDRINTIVPKYRSALHKWEYVESAAIVGSSYLAEDGEEKIDTYQVDLCQDKDQAAQLAAYRLVNGREISPIDITLKPGFRFYRPGDMVTLDIPEMGLVDQDCVIIQRVVDPQNFSVQFTLMSETAAKHDFALGKTGTAPPTPTLTSAEDKDLVAQTNALGGQATAVAFKRSATQPSTPGDSTGTPATWYADTSSVPASANPMWATYGTRENSISDFIWQTPIPAEGIDGIDGIDGTSPPLIVVASTHQTFRYDTTDTPLSQTTTITATRQNTAGTTEWQLREADGTVLYNWRTAASMVSGGGADSSPNNDTLVMDQARFQALLAAGSTTGLILEARMSGATSVQDRISIVKVRDGVEGNAGVGAWTPTTVGGSYTRAGGNLTGIFEVRSTESFAQARASGRITSTADTTAIGLYDPVAGTVYELITYSVFGSDVRRHHYGVAQAATGVAPVVGQAWELAHIGTEIRAFINGIDVGSIGPGVPADRALMASFRTGSGSKTIENCTFAKGGAPGSDGLSIAATKPILTVARNPYGAPKSGELPKTTQLIVYDGFTDITSLCTFSRTVNHCTASNDGGGAFTLTAIGTDGGGVYYNDAYFDVTAEAPDGREITMRIATTAERDGPAASRATAALSTMTTSGTFVEVGHVDIVAADGATISGGGSANYQATNTGAGVRYATAEAKVSIQNLTDGGSESDGSSVVGSAASYIAGDGPSDIGSVSAGHSAPNTSGGPKTFRVRLYMRKYSGLANINTTGGTYSGSVTVEVA